MYDRYGRKIDYIRISVTDRCNLRCRYCMPDGVPLSSMDDLLTFEEIEEIAQTAASLGICHVKLTGGEPLIRRGLPGLVKMLKQTDGISAVTMTTNGTLLMKHLDSLAEAGLDAVNISLDSLDPEIYRNITGTDAVKTVIAAIDAAWKAGLKTRVNAVSIDLCRDEWKQLADLAKERPVDVRFIEMMPIGYGKTFPVLSHEELLKQMKEVWPDMVRDSAPHGFGPAVYYKIPGYRGSIGLISAIHGKFCSSCNRVRLTSKGYLKSCLCYDSGADLREILRSPLPEKEKREQLRLRMQEIIYNKPGEHCFEHTENMTEQALMNAIGG